MIPNSAFRIALLCLFFCLSALLPAGGGKDKGNVVQVSGRVRMVASGMFTEIVITGQENEWYIDRGEDYKLIDLQHQTVTVEGSETIINLTFGNGLPAGERRTLKNIKIIKVEEFPPHGLN